MYSSFFEQIFEFIFMVARDTWSWEMSNYDHLAIISAVGFEDPRTIRRALSFSEF